MKKALFTLSFLLIAAWVFGQTTYYWVGGTTPSTSITTGSNWNTAINGSGSSRPSSSGANDVLIFDGSNVGGSTPATGPVTVLANGSITCGQMKFTNNATITFIRASTGTSTITFSGEDTGDDFVMDPGTTLNFTSTVGSIRMAMTTGSAGPSTGLVFGTINMITTLQARFDNGTGGSPATFIFKSGSSLTTNITSSSSSYAFGSSSQSSEKWVVFEDGSDLYYLGGYSPMGSSSTFSPIDFQPNSTWHHRANNGAGSFFNRKSFGNISVENGAILTADGPVYRINNLTVAAGCSFIPYTSGQTGVMGNITVNGDITAAGSTSNEFVLGGNTTQTISGSGTISVANLTVGNKSTVNLQKNISVDQLVRVYGKIDFHGNQVMGAADFIANGIETPGAGTGVTTTGSYLLTGNTGIATATRGWTISGTGIAPNTTILAFSTTADTIYLSHAMTGTGAGVALSATANGATLETSNTNGFNPANGSVTAAGTQTYEDNINYIIDGATTWPFGISTGGSATTINAAFVEVNAAVTLNRSVNISNHVLVNGKLTLRPLDVLHVQSGASITGTFSNTKYIATDYNGTNGDQGILKVDGIASATTIPVGTITYYMPVMITPASSSDFSIAVFQGITSNGAVTGTPLTPVQKQSVVDAVWNITRTSGSGTADLQLGWDAAQEGSTFATLPDTDIGMIVNNGSSWNLPVGTGDNTNNMVMANLSAFGSFSAGAVPQTNPFVFNPLPPKTYGDPDFNGGATSLNTTQPIMYSSSNPAVAAIVSGDIHIVGAGSCDITASQASDGFYPAASVTQPLTVSKAALTITADNKTRFEGLANPALTATYSGFVLGETPAVFITPLVINTTATIASPPGTYPITVSGATAANYTISFVNGTLTVQPKQTQTITFNNLPVKTYGNADFAAGATSTNNTIPITYSSSNTAVATVTGNIIHITGAGTTSITASQAGNDGYFPAANVTRTLTVNKANLTIKAIDTVRAFGQTNPVFSITYTGFVLGETPANLTTQPSATTTAGISSTPGYYPIDLMGAASSNYNITYTSGRLTVLPLTGTDTPYMIAYLNTKGNLTVRVYQKEVHIGDIMVFDMKGQLVAKKNLLMPAGFISTDVFIPNIVSGVYVVTVRGDGVNLQRMVSIVK